LKTHRSEARRVDRATGNQRPAVALLLLAALALGVAFAGPVAAQEPQAPPPEDLVTDPGVPEPIEETPPALRVPLTTGQEVPERVDVGGTGPAAFEGQTITAVEVRGLANLAEETLLYYLDVAPGQTLRLGSLDSRMKSLWDRELVDDVTIRYQPEAGGVRLLVDVVERPILRSVDYQGLKKLSRGDVQDKIVDERIAVREGAPLAMGELARLESAIEQLYADKGYRFADASYVLEPAGPAEVRAVFTVDEGDRVRIRDIGFEGNTVFPDWRLELEMRKQSSTGPISRLLRHDIYNPGKLEEDLDRIRKLYRERGFKNVALGEPEVEISERGRRRRLELTLPIEEGERFRFGDIRIEGNDVYSDQALLRVFRNRSGEWLKADLIEEGLESVRELYSNTGYMFARIEPEILERDDNVADVVIHVDEGEQFRVGRIDFRGNTRTMDKVLRRELRVQEGYVMNVAALRNSVFKINQLGYFKLNEEEPVEIDVNPEAKLVDLTFVGEEADRTELQFGGGWSEFEGFFGQFAVRTHNFLGRGENVSASFQSGRRQDFFDLGYFVPWFLDRPQTIGLQVFSRSLEYDFFSAQEEYSQTTEGGTLTYGRSFKLFNSLSLSYTRARYEERGQFLNPLTGEFEVFERAAIDSSSIRPVYLFNSINNRLEPTRGTRFTLSSEYAGGPLGGEDNFLRPEMTFTMFRPLGKQYPLRSVFGLNAEVGYLRPFDEGIESRLRYYFLGGERSLRGFAPRSLVPLNDEGLPVRNEFLQLQGGDRFAQVNVEYHFLAGGPFRVVLFTDSANVWAPDQDLDFERLYWTAGVELRVLVPVFGAPLRFIYAFNLGDEPPLGSRDFEDFQFSIGTTF
jgi:outer membrane protein insertion porin family